MFIHIYSEIYNGFHKLEYESDMEFEYWIGMFRERCVYIYVYLDMPLDPKIMNNEGFES